MTDTPLTRALNFELRRLDVNAWRLADSLETADTPWRASALLLLQSINRALGDLAEEARGRPAGLDDAATPTEVQAHAAGPA
jgi:hypothetical protein